MKVLVLLGGDSPERDVSIRSGNSVISALKLSGHVVNSYDPIKGLDGLTKLAQEADVVLPILHGKNGEDGVVQRQLEDIGVPFLGADSKSSKLSISKLKTHRELESAGVKMPNYSIVDSQSFDKSPLASKPFVLKPVEGGSSLDVVIARDLKDSHLAAARELLERYGEMILEELIEGVEITVPVLGQKSLPIIAIVPPEGLEFDYENKYNGKTQEICPVPSSLVSEVIQKQAQKMAVFVQKALGVRHFSRTDMIIRPGGEIVVLELNTIPGMTDQSLFPKSAAVAGLNMVDLTDKLTSLAAKTD